MAKERASADRWGIKNDQIVLMSLMPGMNHAEVARQFGCTRQHVSQLVKDPRAGEIIEIAKRKLREHLIEGIEGELDVMARLAVKVIRKTLEADIDPLHGAKANQDRQASKLLEGRGFLREEGKGAEGGMQMSQDQFERLMKGMEKADEVRGIDPFEGRKEVEPISVKVRSVDPTLLGSGS